MKNTLISDLQNLPKEPLKIITNEITLDKKLKVEKDLKINCTGSLKLETSQIKQNTSKITY